MSGAIVRELRESPQRGEDELERAEPYSDTPGCSGGRTAPPVVATVARWLIRSRSSRSVR